MINPNTRAGRKGVSDADKTRYEWRLWVGSRCIENIPLDSIRPTMRGALKPCRLQAVRYCRGVEACADVIFTGRGVVINAFEDGTRLRETEIKAIRKHFSKAM